MGLRGVRKKTFSTSFLPQPAENNIFVTEDVILTVYHYKVLMLQHQNMPKEDISGCNYGVAIAFIELYYF